MSVLKVVLAPFGPPCESHLWPYERRFSPGESTSLEFQQKRDCGNTKSSSLCRDIVGMSKLLWTSGIPCLSLAQLLQLLFTKAGCDHGEWNIFPCAAGRVFRELASAHQSSIASTQMMCYWRLAGPGSSQLSGVGGNR